MGSKGEPEMSAAARSGIQSHLTITFPVKSAADRKALVEKLPLLMPDFAKAQDTEGSVHYSRFLDLSDQALLFIADIDGEADDLVGALVKSAGPVFDAILEHVENPPPAPVARNTDAFVLWAKQHNTPPLVAYSAYAGNSVRDIKSCAGAAGFTGSSEQHPLLLSLPIKSSLKAFVLEELVLRATHGKMNEGADSVGTLHFAHFVPLPGNHLAFFTIFDGSFHKYIEDFTEKLGPVFDTLFEFVIGPPPTPVAKNADAFFNWAEANNLPPIGLYRAYPGLAVQDIHALVADTKVGATALKA
jgi:hypothetical protein